MMLWADGEDTAHNKIGYTAFFYNTTDGIFTGTQLFLAPHSGNELTVSCHLQGVSWFGPISLKGNGGADDLAALYVLFLETPFFLKAFLDRS